MPFIIDTDPGLDDALAILLALRSPELDVLGLTTVAGNLSLETVTRNARKILALAGRPDVPVVAGAAAPLRRAVLHSPHIHGADGLGGVVFPEPGPAEVEKPLVSWMSATLAQHPPGTVWWLALGPLTNMALFLAERPAEARRLAGIVSMGGAVRDRGNVTPFAEFNIKADPEAAAAVLSSGVPVTLIPLDVTRQVAADEAWGAKLAASPDQVARTSAEMIKAYLDAIAKLRKGASLPRTFPLHDPCVILHVIDPTLFQGETLGVRVITDGGERDGATVIDESVPAVSVLTGADTVRALALVLTRLTGA